MAGRVSRNLILMINSLCTCSIINRSDIEGSQKLDIHQLYFFLLQAGFTVRSFGEDWQNFEWDADDHFEDLWRKGEAGVDLDSFSQSPLVLEPDHYQCLFLIMGFKISLGLIVLLWDILADPKKKFYSLMIKQSIMIAGLFACLLITLANLFFFSTALWTPMYYSTEITRKDLKGYVATDPRIISTGDYEYDIEKLGNNKMVAFAIIGYGAFLSIIFIFFAMVRAIGNPSFSKFTFHF